MAGFSPGLSVLGYRKTNRLSNLEGDMDNNNDELTPDLVKKLETLIGNGVSRGLWGVAWTVFWIWLIVFLIEFGLFKAFDYRKDSTDGDYRSGLEIRVDNLTGCEYLESRNGLTPRLDLDGRQICKGGR
jgi:hypothetical protein